jgi:hypothetical protein
VLPVNHEAWAQNGVELCAAIAVIVYVLWSVIQKIGNSPKTPDPWNDEVALALEDETARPLCPHCLSSHNESDNFCPSCSGPVGTFTNYLPSEYYISLGHVLRTGSDGNFKPTFVLAAGFCLAAFMGRLIVLAPFYWFRVLQNFIRLRETPRSDAESKDPQE